MNTTSISPHYNVFGDSDKSTPGKLTAKSSRCVIAKGLLFSSILTFTVPPDMKKILILPILCKRLVFDHKIRYMGTNFDSQIFLFPVVNQGHPQLSPSSLS